MAAAPVTSPIRLFAAMTRAVRDAPMDEPVRAQAFELLMRLAHHVHQPGFMPLVHELLSLGRGDAALAAVMDPFAAQLIGLATEDGPQLTNQRTQQRQAASTTDEA